MPPGNACSRCPPWSSTCCAPSPPSSPTGWTSPPWSSSPPTGPARRTAPTCTPTLDRPAVPTRTPAPTRPVAPTRAPTPTRLVAPTRTPVPDRRAAPIRTPAPAPTGGTDPDTGAHSTGGADPNTGTRPTGGADPNTGTRPTGGANPRTSTQRYADAVWRIRYAGADASADARTLVLLLEFQSTVDPDMAARTLAYTSLLREHLRRQGKFDPDGGLRTLAVVVYSGPKPWSAAGAADAVPLSPDGTPLLPVVAPYRLLDSRRAAADDSTERNPALAVLGVEGAASPAQAAARMQAMAAWLPQVLADRDVRREFGASVAAWLAATMPRLFPSADGEEIESIGLGPVRGGRNDDAAPEGERVGGRVAAPRHRAGHGTAAWPKAWSAGWRRAWSAVWHKAWNAAWREVWSAAWHRVWSAAWRKAWSTAWPRNGRCCVSRRRASSAPRWARHWHATWSPASDAEALRDIGVLIHRLRRRRGVARPRPPARRRLRPPSPTFTTSSPGWRVPTVRPDHRQGDIAFEAFAADPDGGTRCREQIVCPVRQHAGCPI